MKVMNFTTEFSNEADKVKTWLSDELNKVRTGRATPSFLDAIQVESYGSLMPINQVASVNTEDARTLRIAPWDSSMIQAIDTAISKADLGVSTSVDDQGVRVHFPELTTETREKISRNAKQKHEDARIRLRGIRDEVRSTIAKLQKGADLSEDEAKRAYEAVEEKTSQYNSDFDQMYDKKHNELTAL